ncbi:hypothetical protein [Lentzea xinjiangensis]|uniref:hypothetical protein n=1 Tax=Lentzea xinjiangensis TaxID=402600 RepID=UPI000B7F6975|nr:hypothetical protein [Lentzea xinjiangensis]
MFDGVNRPSCQASTAVVGALLNVEGDVWRDARWRLRVVVAGLGTNDFSTALVPGEPWTPESWSPSTRPLPGVLGELWARYGTGTTIVVSVPEAMGTFADAARQVVQERGDPRVHLATTPIRRSTGSGATGTPRP